MKFCPVVPEICRGQVHGPRKERKENNNNNNNNNNKKRSKNNKFCLGDKLKIIKRYDYNLTIMKSPKPATENRFQK
jgi:hypothetical protein